MRNHMQDSNCFGFHAKGVFDELRAVADECSNPGWDGNTATPILDITVQKAEQFLATLPLGIDAPSVSAEPDGCVTFEWYKSPIHVLSVSISADGYLHYAYLHGEKRKYGSEPFANSVSRDIIALIMNGKG